MLKKISKKTLIYIFVFIAVIGVVAGLIVGSFADMKVSKELSALEAEIIVTDTLERLPKSVSAGANEVAKKSSIKVNGIKYGEEKNIVLDC